MVVAGADILGLKVPRTDPVFLAVLAIHVLAALSCLVSGAVAALSAKGSVRHIRSGGMYYWFLGIVFVTATTMAAMRWAEDYRLFVIGSIAITAGSVGYLHRRLRRPGDTVHITGMGASYIALLTAFYVDNGENLPLWSHLPHIAYWVLPSLFGLPLVARAVRRAQTATAPGREPSRRLASDAPEARGRVHVSPDAGGLVSPLADQQDSQQPSPRPLPRRQQRARGADAAARPSEGRGKERRSDLRPCRTI